MSGPVQDGEHLYFTGDSLIFHSTNRGESWELVSTISGVFALEHLNVFSDRWTVHSVAFDPVLEVGSYRILQTENRGQTWDTLLSTTDYLESASAIAFRDRDNGYYGTRSGTLYRTTNGGTQWVKVADVDTTVNAIAFLTDSLFYLVGNNGMTAHSTDAGHTWTTEYVLPETGATPRLLSIRLAPDGLSVFVTGEGVLMRGDFPEPVTSAPEELEVSEVGLHLSVHPNPVVGDEVRLRVGGLGRGDAEVELYDVTGRLLESQVVVGQGGGDASYRLSVAGIVPGVYRVVVRQGGREANLPVTIVR